MAQTFYFYDLETSGFSPKSARIMQFAGQRTGLDLNPIGESDNILVKITPDILPDPGAILVTGITPQKTLSDGITEVEFLRYFHEKIAISDTIFVGFNTVRFDDEFIRYTNYRNFYDAYEWQWSEGRGRWDIMDVTRMTRALRPDGIKWPFAPDGKPSIRLELMAAINKLEHANAHDALSDVYATIGVAKLLKQKQPKLFDYLLKMRDKKEVEKLVTKTEPFVYTSGRFSSEYEKTTVAVTVAPHPVQKGSVYVYDLRYDPTPFIDMKPDALASLMNVFKQEEGTLRLPVKQMQFNKCPAVAPLSVLTAEDKARLQLDDQQIEKNFAALLAMNDFSDRLQEAVRINEKQRQTTFVVDVKDVDAQLYDGFINDADKTKMRVVRAADANELADLHLDFNDTRLEALLLLYKARQFPQSLTPEEQAAWHDYCKHILLDGGEKSRVQRFAEALQEAAKRPDLTQDQSYLLQELQLYAESILPYEA